MPSMSGPSMTSIGRAALRRASSTSASTWSRMPSTSAWRRRSVTGNARHAASARVATVLSRCCSARVVSRSVASGRRLNSTSSTTTSTSAGTSSYTASWAALTMPMSIPAPIAWYRNAECIASRTWALPRNANDRLLTPPLTRARGNVALMRRTASRYAIAYVLCSSIPVATAKMLGSKMMSSGGNPARSVRSLYARAQMATLRSAVSAWPCSSNAITTTAAP